MCFCTHACAQESKLLQVLKNNNTWFFRLFSLNTIIWIYGRSCMDHFMILFTAWRWSLYKQAQAWYCYISYFVLWKERRSDNFTTTPRWVKSSYHDFNFFFLRVNHPFNIIILVRLVAKPWLVSLTHLETSVTSSISMQNGNTHMNWHLKRKCQM